MDAAKTCSPAVQVICKRHSQLVCHPVSHKLGYYCSIKGTKPFKGVLKTYTTPSVTKDLTDKNHRCSFCNRVITTKGAMSATGAKICPSCYKKAKQLCNSMT